MKLSKQIIRQKMKLSKQIILKKGVFELSNFRSLGNFFLLDTYSQCVFFMPYSTATLKQPSPKKTTIFTLRISKVCKLYLSPIMRTIAQNNPKYRRTLQLQTCKVHLLCWLLMKYYNLSKVCNFSNYKIVSELVNFANFASVFELQSYAFKINYCIINQYVIFFSCKKYS